MELSFDRRELLKHISLLAKIAPLESKVSAMTGILIEADKENYELTMTATNGSTALRLCTAAAVRQGGMAVVNAQMLQAFLTKLGDSLITFQIDAKYRVHIKSGESEAEFSALPAEKFPQLGNLLEEDAAPFLSISGWPSFLSRPLFCTHGGFEENGSTSCLQLSVKEGQLRGICCDGNQIFSAVRPCECETAFQILIPSGAASIISCVADDESELTLHITQKSVQLRRQNFLLSTMLVHQPFLPVDAVIGSLKKAFAAVISIREFLETLELAAAAGAPITNLVITKDGVQLRPYSKLSKADLPLIPASKCRPTDKSGFFYRTGKLLQGVRAFKNVESGKALLWLTSAGVLMLEAPEQYFMIPVTKKPATPKVQKAA